MICLKVNQLKNGKFGHVKFYETEAVDKAVELAGSVIKGVPIRMDFAEDKPLAAYRAGKDRMTGGEQAPSKPRPEDCHTIWIGGLPAAVDEDMIRDFLQDAGAISEIRLDAARKNGAPFCHVEFVETASVEKACRLSGDRWATAGSRLTTRRIAARREVRRPPEGRRRCPMACHRRQDGTQAWARRHRRDGTPAWVRLIRCRRRAGILAWGRLRRRRRRVGIQAWGRRLAIPAGRRRLAIPEAPVRRQAAGQEFRRVLQGRHQHRHYRREHQGRCRRLIGAARRHLAMQVMFRLAPRQERRRAPRQERRQAECRLRSRGRRSPRSAIRTAATATRIVTAIAIHPLRPGSLWPHLPRRSRLRHRHEDRAIARPPRWWVAHMSSRLVLSEPTSLDSRNPPRPHRCHVGLSG